MDLNVNPTRALATYRVSTDGQQNSGLGLAAQQETVRREAAARGWELTEMPPDVASGTKMDKRPSLAAALDAMDRGEHDVLVAAKLDRISRSVVDFGTMLARAQRHGWSMVVLDLGIDMTQDTGRLVAQILVSVAEWEAARIATRTKEALARVPRGTTHIDKDGNEKQPPGRARVITDQQIATARKLRAKGFSVAEVAQTVGTSRTALYKYLTD